MILMAFLVRQVRVSLHEWDGKSAIREEATLIAASGHEPPSLSTPQPCLAEPVHYSSKLGGIQVWYYSLNDTQFHSPKHTGSPHLGNVNVL